MHKDTSAPMDDKQRTWLARHNTMTSVNPFHYYQCLDTSQTMYDSLVLYQLTSQRLSIGNTETRHVALSPWVAWISAAAPFVPILLSSSSSFIPPIHVIFSFNNRRIRTRLQGKHVVLILKKQTLVKCQVIIPLGVGATSSKGRHADTIVNHYHYVQGGKVEDH